MRVAISYCGMVQAYGHVASDAGLRLIELLYLHAFVYKSLDISFIHAIPRIWPQIIQISRACVDF